MCLQSYAVGKFKLHLCTHTQWALSSTSHSSLGTYLGYNVPFISMFTKSDRECILGSKYYRILNRVDFFVCLFFTKQKGLI